MSVATHDVHKTGNEIKFSPEAQLLVDKHLAKYPEGKKKSAILPLLHLAQQELGGWLSVDVQDYIASILKIAPIEVYEVVTFYSQYYTKPVGKYVFEVCRTSPCKLRGSDEIIEYIENKLSIKDGQTTPDGMFTLKTVECWQHVAWHLLCNAVCLIMSF